MTILVTGANGQLGNEMRIVTKGSKDRYIFTDVCDEHPESLEMLRNLAGGDVDTTTTQLDITNIDAIRKMVKEEDVKVIVNCAAWTNVDGAEDPEKYELVELLNAKAPESLAIVMKEVGGLLVHISTDYVFGGDPFNTPCKEDQKGTPTGVYGLTKLHGEQKIQATGVDYLIFRTAWLYSEFGKNFVKTMLNLTVTKPQLKVVFDQVGTPTYARDLAEAILVAIDDYKKETVNCKLSTVNFSKTGIYHFSDEGVCSWFDFTKKIAEYSEQTACIIQPCHSDEFPSPVKRPAYSVLDKTKFKTTFVYTIPYWNDSLRICMKNIRIVKRDCVCNKIYKRMKVLVTGANGYIGRHVVKALLDKGAEVIACDIVTNDVDSRAERKTLNLFELPEGNVYEQLGSPDVCLHMAWRNGFVHNAPTQIGDLSAHYKFLTAMIDGGLKQLAVMGSMHEVGYWEGAIDENTPCNPISMYGIAKDALRRSMILYCKQKECILQWLRCYYILGDDKKNNSIFCKLLLAAEEGKKTFPFTTGKNQYDFITVDELANQLSAAVMQKEVIGIINCCTGKPMSLADRVEQFIKEHNLDIKLEYGAFPDRPYDSPCEYGDSTKIHQIMK